MTPTNEETIAPDNKPLLAVEALLRGMKPTANPFEVTIERLGSAIKMGLYEPGDRLPSERQIAELMGISRATIREAIRVLATQGFIVVTRGRTGGTFVARDFTPSKVEKIQHRLNENGVTLAEFLDYRLVVETSVVELAAQRAQEIHKAELQKLVDAMQNGEDAFSNYRKLDTKFHLLIATATQNHRLAAAMADIHADLSDLLSSVPYSKTACIHSTEQHQEIVDSIRKNRPDVARLVMKEHLLATSSYVTGLL